MGLKYCFCLHFGHYTVKHASRPPVLKDYPCRPPKLYFSLKFTSSLFTQVLLHITIPCWPHNWTSKQWSSCSCLTSSIFKACGQVDRAGSKGLGFNSHHWSYVEVSGKQSMLPLFTLQEWVDDCHWLSLQKMCWILPRGTETIKACVQIQGVWTLLSAELTGITYFPDYFPDLEYFPGLLGYPNK